MLVSGVPVALWEGLSPRCGIKENIGSRLAPLSRLGRSPGGGAGHGAGLQCQGHALPHPPPGPRLRDQLDSRER